MATQRLTRQDVERLMERDPQKLCAALTSVLMTAASRTGPAGLNKGVDYICTLVDDKQGKFIKVLLRRLHQTTQNVKQDFRPIHELVFLFFVFESYEACPLRPVIWNAGAMPVLLDAFSVLSKASLVHPRNMHIIDAWNHCFMLIADSATSIYGRSLLIQALQRGFLKNFATCFPVTAQPSNLQFRGKFTECLTKTSRYFLYTSILPAVEAEMEGISRTHQRRMADGSLGSEWRAFLRYFVERLVYKWYSDFCESRRGKIYLCDNCGEGSSQQFKKCAGCQKASYCSKKCQADAWKEHKADCNRYQHRKSGENTPHDGPVIRPPPKKELEFMLHVATNDACRHQDYLRAMASQRYPKLARNELAVLIDYCEFPPVLDVYPFAAFKAELEEFPNLRGERAVKRLGGGDGKLMALEFRVPNNGKRVSIHETFTMSSLDEHELPMRPSLSRTRFVDTEGRPIKATKDIIDEIMLQSGFTTDVLLETDMSIANIHSNVLQACESLLGPIFMMELYEALGLD